MDERIDIPDPHELPALTQEELEEAARRHAMFLPTVHSEHCTGCGKCEKACVTEEAAIKVLAKAGEPMTCKAMVEAMTKQGLWTSPGGATPDATLYSSILRDLRKGKDARFKKTAVEVGLDVGQMDPYGFAKTSVTCALSGLSNTRLGHRPSRSMSSRWLV